MKKQLKKMLAKLKRFFLHENLQRLEQILMTQGRILSLQNTQIARELKSTKSQTMLNANRGGGNSYGFVPFFIESTEFKIFSQNGEDGIIDFLIQLLDLSAYPKAFIEFGVENYTESNTRFLLQHRNFMGLVLDGSGENIDSIKHDELYWRFDLETQCAFITKENIDKIITSYLKSRDLENVALLSIDIDGNDYYVWEAIKCIEPAIVVVEYNAIFGAQKCVSVPYRADFNRFKAHFSGLYFGASIRALIQLGETKGYAFVGADSSGTNLFFIKNHFKEALSLIATHNLESYCTRHLARQSRDVDANLTFLSHTAREREIAHLPLFEI